MPNDLAFDFTARIYDANGWLHISRSHISKARINPYYGREIPGSSALGLDPNKMYYLLRDPEELAKGADTFKINPILSKHIPLKDFDSLEEKEKKKYIVGSIGSNVEFLEPYLDADVTIWDADAIVGIETEKVREFSCSYRYVPIMTTGTYNGQKYDGIMTQIRGNHVALVESGRAGSDVLAADSTIERKQPMIRTKLGNALIVALTTAFPKLQVAQDSALEKILAPATRQAFDKAGAKTLILAMDADMPAKEKEVDAVMDALVDVDDPKPSKKDEEEKRAADKKAADKKAADKRAADAESEHPKGCMCADCKTARDEAPAEKKDEEKDKKAMDEMGKTIRAEIREAEQAKRAVRPIVGDIFAQDSAAEIYGFALDHLKVDRTGVEGTRALQALFNAASKPNTTPAAPHLAMDSNTAEKMFPNLARIRQG